MSSAPQLQYPPPPAQPPLYVGPVWCQVPYDQLHSLTQKPRKREGTITKLKRGRSRDALLSINLFRPYTENKNRARQLEDEAAAEQGLAERITELEKEKDEWLDTRIELQRDVEDKDQTISYYARQEEELEAQIIAIQDEHEKDERIVQLKEECDMQERNTKITADYRTIYAKYAGLKKDAEQFQQELDASAMEKVQLWNKINDTSAALQDFTTMNEELNLQVKKMERENEVKHDLIHRLRHEVTLLRTEAGLPSSFAQGHTSSVRKATNGDGGSGAEDLSPATYQLRSKSRKRTLEDTQTQAAGTNDLSGKCFANDGMRRSSRLRQSIRSKGLELDEETV